MEPTGHCELTALANEMSSANEIDFDPAESHGVPQCAHDCPGATDLHHTLLKVDPNEQAMFAAFCTYVATMSADADLTCVLDCDGDTLNTIFMLAGECAAQYEYEQTGATPTSMAQYQGHEPTPTSNIVQHHHANAAADAQAVWARMGSVDPSST